MNTVVNHQNHKFMNTRILKFIAYKKLLIMHCLMSSEEWHRKIPFTGYLLAISISVPVVDLEGVRRVASGAQNIVFLAGWELLEY